MNFLNELRLVFQLFEESSGFFCFDLDLVFVLVLELIYLSAMGNFEFVKDLVLLLDFVLKTVVLFHELVEFDNEVALLRFMHFLLILKL